MDARGKVKTVDAISLHVREVVLLGRVDSILPLLRSDRSVRNVADYRYLYAFRPTTGTGTKLVKAREDPKIHMLTRLVPE